MAIDTLEEKFAHGLGSIYDAEHQFLEAMEEMLTQATSNTVKSLLKEHITQTKQQIRNLEQAFKILGQEAEQIDCEGAEGLVSEGATLMDEAADNPAMLDFAIAGAADKVEHYEIATYRGLIAEAQQMGQNEIVRLLRDNLQQEEQTAQKIEQSVPALLQQATSRAAGA